MGASQRIETMYDMPMWESIERKRLELPRCESCGSFSYPPSPVCSECLSMEHQWTPVSGQGVILSWVVFHRQYFDDHVPPYNAVAVRLVEGPIVVSRLIGDTPPGSWIGAEVDLCYASHQGHMQHFVRLRET